MLPAQHLRAGIFVVERAAVALVARGGSVKGSYILDVGPYPTAEMAKHSLGERYWDGADAAEAAAAAAGACGALPCAGPSLPGHSALAGLAVLKEALRICERYYPETLTRVYFYRPNFAFRAVFAIFRLWVPKATRRRFVLVREGEEASAFFGPPPHGCGLSREDAPRELGGSGPSLDGDRFLMRACERYDREAPLPAT